MVETGHGGEVFGGNVGSVVLADHSVGVSRVTNNDSLSVTSAVIIDSFTNINEDLAIVLKKIRALHTRSARLRTHQEVIINIFKSDGKITSDHDVVEEGESAIMQLSHHTFEHLLLEGQIEEVENHALVLAEELTARDSEDDGVGDLASSAGDENSLGLIVQGGLVDSHAASSEWSHLSEGVGELFAEVGDHSVCLLWKA